MKNQFFSETIIILTIVSEVSGEETVLHKLCIIFFVAMDLKVDEVFEQHWLWQDNLYH